MWLGQLLSFCPPVVVGAGVRSRSCGLRVQLRAQSWAAVPVPGCQVKNPSWPGPGQQLSPRPLWLRKPWDEGELFALSLEQPRLRGFSLPRNTSTRNVLSDAELGGKTPSIHPVFQPLEIEITRSELSSCPGRCCVLLHGWWWIPNSHLQPPQPQELSGCERADFAFPAK